jgi:hypothetical protein
MGTLRLPIRIAPDDRYCDRRPKGRTAYHAADIVASPSASKPTW